MMFDTHLFDLPNVFQAGLELVVVAVATAVEAAGHLLLFFF
jgi:hypothetical protein